MHWINLDEEKSFCVECYELKYFHQMFLVANRILAFYEQICFMK
jgi:hypothetical protein